LLGPNVRRVPASQLGPNEVVLTFDDGPDPEVTPRVVELLDLAGCSASFFFIGQQAERFGEIAEDTARRGNGVENHSYGHSKAFAFYGARRLGREIDRAQDLLASVSGRTPRYFRAPAGIRSVCLDPVLHRRGLTLVSWTRRGFDTVERRPEIVARRLVRHLAPGDLLMLHDGSSCRDRRGEPVVLETLKRVLEILERRGLRGVGLPASLPLE
jgi:peptidoglycan/xylan/chitin deacetylase (PgdA/CDA1 family)